MARISDRNNLRKRQYTMAMLLGVRILTIEDFRIEDEHDWQRAAKPHSSGRWAIHLPRSYRIHYGYEKRYEAVYFALAALQVPDLKRPW